MDHQLKALPQTDWPAARPEWKRVAGDHYNPLSLNVSHDDRQSGASGDLLAVRSFAFERLNANAVVLDKRGVIIDSNETWRLYAHLNDGASSSTGIGVSYLGVCDRATGSGADVASAVAAGLRQIIAGDRTRFDLEYPCDSPSESRWFRLQASSAPVSRGTGVVVLHVDITASKLRELQLEVLVERDPLTGLPNRAAARRCLAGLLADSAAQCPTTVMFVDLDGFKSVNDTFGHHVGDELLARVSSRLRHAVRADDMVCRFGGDEFVLVCSDLTPADATSIADRIGTVMRQAFQIGADVVHIGASIGCSTSTPGCSAESMLREADAAMYEMKAGSPQLRSCDLQRAQVPPGRCSDRRLSQPPTVDQPGDGRPVPNPPRLTVETPSAPRHLAVAGSPGVLGARLRSIPEALTEAVLSAVVNRSTDVAMFFEGDGTIAWVSPASSDVFGIAPHELVGGCGFDLIHPEDRERVVGEFLRGSPKPGTPARVEFRINDPDGEVRWVEEIVTDLTGDPDVGFIVGNLRDVTGRKDSEAALARLALVDELTGLPNRNSLLDAIHRSERSTDVRQMIGLVLFDLDDYCDVNDAFGHDAGDAVLVELARRVRTAVRNDALVARISGNQFGVFGADLSCEQACEEIVRTVQANLASPFEIGGHELTVSATSGIALATADHAQELIRDADAALYRAKVTSRGGSVVFRPEIAEDATSRLRRTSDLRLAVSRQEIVPLYQPVVDLASGQVVAVEALARWNHPEHGWVTPDKFIPLAERTGLIEQLGQQILELACADAVGWLRDGRRLHVAINASGVQLTSPRFVPMVDAALAASGLPADQLTIEITETAEMHDSAMANTVLAALQDRSIRLSLDDFGTGYSPLTALRDLPVQSIKLDRTFVSGLGCRAGDDLAAGILQLGIAAGTFVVAEGVETRAQADQLYMLGCQFGQGYLWSPAVAGRDLLATIEQIELMA